MDKLFLLNVEHESATRVPGKPLRPFGDTCLFDIYLDKFRALESGAETEGHPFWYAGIALWPGDKRLVKKVDDAGDYWDACNYLRCGRYGYASFRCGLWLNEALAQMNPTDGH